MTRDQTIALAKEAGGAHAAPYRHWRMTNANLEHFAALVAATTREECARAADLVAREIDDTNGTATYIAAAIRSMK